jgi:glycogen debranching enzyme
VEIRRTPRCGTVSTLDRGAPRRHGDPLRGRDLLHRLGNGDIEPGGTQGLFVLEARILSCFQLLVDGVVPEPLATKADDPHHATFVGCVGERILVERSREVGDGLRDEIVVRNVGDEASYVGLELVVDADFAVPRAVRAGRVKVTDVAAEIDGPDLVFTQRRGRHGVRVHIDAGGRVPSSVEPGRVALEAIVPPGGAWRLLVDVAALVDGARVEPHRRAGEDRGPAERLARWRRGLPQVSTDHAGLAAAVARCADDLGALRVFDPDVPERAVVAAGVPWAMALHARDALLTAWSALLVDPDLAIGVLETLARLQGVEDDGRTEEEPGRIPRRVPFGGGAPTYGAVDTTPLFVMLLGEVRRWGLAPETVERLLPHVDAGLRWCEERGDRDGDGFIEYERAHDRGRKHQGWRDSDAGLRAADGRIGQPPIALAEVQALHYAALVARSHFAREAGDEAGERSWRTRADELGARFAERFWLDDVGYPALALDHEKRPLDALGSHLGWCLWTGILSEDQAASVAKHLVSPDLFTGWGVRTLAASTVGSTPLGYHHGAVWPHDTAIAAAGLARYGFADEALLLLGGLLDAAVAFDGRLPELFAGFDRADLDMPVRFPNACVPSAWASASVLLGLRTVLRFDPWVPAGRVHVAPVLPAGVLRLRIDDIPLLGGRISVAVDADGEVRVEDVPPGIDVVYGPRRPIGGPERG